VLFGIPTSFARAAFAAVVLAATLTGFSATTAQATTLSATPSLASVQGSAHAVLVYGYAQLGKPYRMGGAGPSSFDCSGLAMRSWAAAGVRLAHYSGTQQHQGRPVPLSELQPGDLVFWGHPAYHVAIYVGGGRILDAPHTGTVVQIRAIWATPTNAIRP